MNKKLISLALLAGVALAGCGTLSQVDNQGQTDDPVFPKVEDINFHTGSYPNLENLRNVSDGATRDQLYNLLGRPHFSEGFKVREWDYLFHFNTAEGVKTCQYKILFDKDKLARSFHWAPESCADLVNGTPAKEAVTTPFSLSGDVGFAFGSAVLTAAGVSQVTNMAQQLQQAGTVENVVVSGHTDRIGDAASNQRLSQQRAEAVRRVLLNEGISPATVQAQGFGKDRPVVQCDQTNRAELIACLAPNRRVDLEAKVQQ